MPRLPFRRRAPERPVPRYVTMAGARYSARPPREPRRIPWRAIAAVTGVVAVLGATAFGGVTLYQSDVLRVQQVRVVGAQVVSPEEAALAAAVARHSLLHLDTAAAAGRVQALPGVREARVHRDWPQGVVIDLTEREGWGYWQVLGTRSLIDADGVVVDRARPPAANAPIIFETGASQPLEPGARVDADTVALVARLQGDGTFKRLGVQPQRYEFERSRGLVVRVHGGPAAVFGDSHDYEFKVAAWVATNQRIKADRMQVNEIDLRFGRELVVR